MAKEFQKYKIKSIDKLLANNPDLNPDDFKLKLLHKKADEIYIFSNRDFKKYSDECDARIIGNIRMRQKHYENYVDDIELRKHKRKKNILARADLFILKDDEYKYYDVREANKMHSVGYAWIGGNNFLRVTAFNPLWLLLPLLLVLAICILLNFCSKSTADKPIHIEQGEIISENPDNNNQPELCYFPPLKETVTLTSENKEIYMINDIINKDKYLVSYEIFVDGEKYYETDAIEASSDKAVKYDLWSQLDAGTYKLELRTSSYDCNTYEEKPGHHILPATLVVNK